MRRVDQPAIHAGQLLLWPGPLRLAEQATSPVVTDTGAHQRVFEEFIEAFRTGRLGVMDYYNLRNLQSDTEMRKSIAGAGLGGGSDRGERPSA